MLNTLENLIKLARERKKNPIEGSYTNKLLLDKSLSKAKVLEEVDELIEAIEFEVPEKSGYAKFPNPASRYAMAGVFISKSDQEIRVAVTGAGEKGVFRWKEMEDALHNDWSIKSAESISLTSDGVMSDIHGNSDYRANLVNIMAIRAVETLSNGN